MNYNKPFAIKYRNPFLSPEAIIFNGDNIVDVVNFMLDRDYDDEDAKEHYKIINDNSTEVYPLDEDGSWIINKSNIIVKEIADPIYDYSPKLVFDENEFNEQYSLNINNNITINKIKQSTFELAKEKGFNSEQIPFQMELCQWLMTKDIYISINTYLSSNNKNKIAFEYEIVNCINGVECIFTFNKKPYLHENYEECFEEALEIALRNQ